MDQTRPRRTELVYDYIKQAILDGVLDAAPWIPIERISADLGVSRQPVMDSLKRLAIEGFVTIVPQVGCRLRSYEPTQIDDFFKLFAEGEALVAELAASRATEDDVAEMGAISARIGRLRAGAMSNEERGRAYRRLNRALHLRMRQTARSPAVAEIVEGLGDRSDFFIALARRPIFAARLEQAHTEHEALLAEVSAGNASAAGAVIRAHILAIGARLRTGSDVPRMATP
jgi:DNA-binding GntR family transcriptional regulator